MYYSVVYNEWFWEQCPESRIVDANGRSEKLLIGTPPHAYRPSVCCPNSPDYREFMVAQLNEICDRYDFEGVYPDNGFWPTVCYCSTCRERYAREVGGEIPRIINWEDPVWVRFQRKRQEWISEFAFLITDTVKRKKPEATVSHQANIWNGDWLLGPSVHMAGATDWLAADAGGDRGELSYVAKMFYGLSNRKPFEMIHVWYHWETVAWTEERMRCATFAAFIHNGARTFIDGIDPAGTMNPDNHIRAGKAFSELEKYESYGGGEYLQDIAVYISFDSFISLSENGCPVEAMRYNFDPTRPWPERESHRSAAIGMCRALLQHHVQFGVITAKDLSNLDRYQAVILPNLVMMRPDEAAAFREYVAKGGNLYVSRNTALISSEGVRQGNFMLSDVCGVSYAGETDSVVTYAAPRETAKELFSPFTREYPSTLQGAMTQVKANPGAAILATITLPYTDPHSTRYASMLANPPGVATDWPSVVLNRFGKGTALYTAGVFELWEYETQRTVVCNLVKMLCPHPLIETDAPKPVEVTVFDQPEHRRCIIHLFNYQHDLPNIPVEGITMRVRIDGGKPVELSVVPQGTEIPFHLDEGHIQFVVPRLETYLMLKLEYH